MLDFPSTGLVAGVTTVTGPSGQEWMWDGVKWIAIGGGGGGPSGPQQGDVRFSGGKLQQYDGSAWQDISVGGGGGGMGVTDGSNAAPGEVGEFIFVEMPQSTIFGSNQRILDLPLSAGDWDVAARANMYIPAGGWVGILLNRTGPIMMFSDNINFAGNTTDTWTTPALQANVATAFTVTLTISFSTSPAPMTVESAHILARRMR